MRAIAIVVARVPLRAGAARTSVRGGDPAPAPARGSQVNSAPEAIFAAIFMLLGIMTAKAPPPCDRLDVRPP